MSNNSLKIWIEEFNQLLTELTRKLQDSEDKIQKQKDKQLESSEGNQNKFLQLNQIANDNKDLLVMKYHDDQFWLSQFMFSTRYTESQCKVKLIDVDSEHEIPQKNYRNSIFEFSACDKNAVLLIKQVYKGNASFKINDEMKIKEVFIGQLQDNLLRLYKITNINTCTQVSLHPLCSRYVLILQTTQLWNRHHTHTSDQYFSVYDIAKAKQPKLRLNMQSCMKGEAQSFSFSSEHDDSQLLLYFINTFGEMYYYDLILPGMTVNLNTKLHLNKYYSEITEFVEQKTQSEFITRYDCTTSDEYKNKQIKFKMIEQQNYHFDQCQTMILSKMQIKDYHLFIVTCQLPNGNLIISVLMGEDLSKIYEIYKEEIIIKSDINNEPKIVYNKNNVVHLTQNQYDLPNRFQLILSYNNSLIIVDYSNVIQFRQDQSPINVTCLDLSHSLQVGRNKDNIQQYLINQVLCLDLFNTKSMLFKAITKEGKSFYYLLSHKILLSLTEPNQELNKIALEFYQEKNAYQLNKQALKQLKLKLKSIREQKLAQCKTEEDVIKLNEDLQSNFVNSINRIAIRIKLESENVKIYYTQMFNDIDLKLRGDLRQQANTNIALQQKILDKNEKINSLLEKLKSIPKESIYLQLKNLQMRSDLEAYQKQFQNIVNNVIESKTLLGEEIQKSQRGEQDIQAIETNLIYQLQAQKNKKV